MNRKKAVLKPIEVSDADREDLNKVLASNKLPIIKKSDSEENCWRLLYYMWSNCDKRPYSTLMARVQLKSIVIIASRK